MILLTGATGYLGSQIAAELIRRGEPFRVLVRNASRLEFDPANSACEVVLGDVCDARVVAKALRGVKQAIHTAALVKMWVRDPREFWSVNVEGLKNFLNASAEAGVEKIIYTSSFIALGPSASRRSAEDLRHDGRYSNEYEQTKAEALAWLREEGFRRYPVVAMMPGVIYGPGPATEANLVGGMIAQFLAGSFPGILGSGKQRWSFAYNREVVLAHLAALEAGRVGESYILGGDNRSLNDFFSVLAAVSGVHREVRHLPLIAGKIFGGVEAFRARRSGRQPQLTPGVVDIFKHDWVYSSAKAVRELGYHVVTLEKGLSETLEAGRKAARASGRTSAAKSG